jgi:hypothetical protein
MTLPRRTARHALGTTAGAAGRMTGSKADAGFNPGIVAVAVISVIILCFLSFSALQNAAVYEKAGKYLIRNYYSVNGNILKGEVPYVKPDASEMLHWDAGIYDRIRHDGYNVSKAGGDYIFAFFPLFPAFWRITQLGPIGISLFNYFLFALSVIILYLVCRPGIKSTASKFILISLCMPMLAVFIMPYSEGLFMLNSTLAVYGIYKNKYALYFPAAFLMAMTRPSAVIIASAFVAAFLYFLIKNSNSKKNLSGNPPPETKSSYHQGNYKNLLLKLLPVICGTFAVSGIQLLYGSGKIFRFMEAQKYWGSGLRLPDHLTDWAHEQFGTNISIVILTVSALVYLTVSVFSPKKERSPLVAWQASAGGHQELDYLFILSLMYMAGTAISVLSMRGGSLNGISRYVLCTPFYYIALAGLGAKMAAFKLHIRLIFFFTMFFITAAALSFIGYSSKWNFSDAGFLILYSQAAFFIFPGLAKSNIFTMFHIVLASVWTSYLFNMFLSGVWIFT